MGTKAELAKNIRQLNGRIIGWRGATESSNEVETLTRVLDMITELTGISGSISQSVLTADGRIAKAEEKVAARDKRITALEKDLQMMIEDNDYLRVGIGKVVTVIEYRITGYKSELAKLNNGVYNTDAPIIKNDCRFRIVTGLLYAKGDLEKHTGGSDVKDAL